MLARGAALRVASAQLRRGLSAVGQHRPFLRRDAERLRCVGNGAFVLGSTNPGIRIEPDFISEAEAEALLDAVSGAASRYGYQYDGDTRAHTLGETGEIESTSDLVNNVRVTGRLERPELQRLPPWGYGDDFCESELPAAFAQLVARVRHCGGFHLGPLRDVTINGREHSYFQLDPHVGASLSPARRTPTRPCPADRRGLARTSPQTPPPTARTSSCCRCYHRS